MGEGPGGCLRGILGGGGLNIFFRGRNAHQAIDSGGNKRDKLKGTNAQDSQFFADFRRFLLIFAFPGKYSISGAQIFAENRRKPQIFAENRRNPQIFAGNRLSHLVCPFWFRPIDEDPINPLQNGPLILDQAWWDPLWDPSKPQLQRNQKSALWLLPGGSKIALWVYIEFPFNKHLLTLRIF